MGEPHVQHFLVLSASGVACSPPDNNCLESYQRIVGKCLGGRPQRLSALLPRYFERSAQREVPARRDTSSFSETRVPWFVDAQSLSAGGDQELLRNHATGHHECASARKQTRKEESMLFMQESHWPKSLLHNMQWSDA